MRWRQLVTELIDASQFYPWSPMRTRAALQWPGHRPVAVAVVLLLEHADGTQAEGSVRLPGASSLRVAPNLLFRSYREYGYRVGIFRMLDELRDLGVPLSVAIDAEAARRYPFVLECCAELDAEFLAHGVQADLTISSALSESAELDLLSTARDVVATRTGRNVTGWFSPEQSESAMTVMLLDRLAFDYVCDWPNDEQPYLLSTPRRIVSIPTTYPLDDAVLVWPHLDRPENYTDAVTTAFDVLVGDSRRDGRGRTLVLVVRPWVSGRAYQIDAFVQALGHISDSGAAWLTTTGAIAASARNQLLDPAAKVNNSIA
jgi:allantoinase